VSESSSRKISTVRKGNNVKMASYYDEVEVRALDTTQEMKLITTQIEDMEFDEENLVFHSPCPCGDRFEISLVSSNLVLYFLPVTDCGEQSQLMDGEDIARCPSCSLIIRVIYDPVTQTQKWADCKDDFVDEKEEKEDAVLPVEVTA
jgi:diphthamide biosynthesis protein 3